MFKKGDKITLKREFVKKYDMGANDYLIVGHIEDNGTWQERHHNAKCLDELTGNRTDNHNCAGLYFWRFEFYRPKNKVVTRPRIFVLRS